MKLKTLSPANLQINRKAESAVKKAKRLMLKAKAIGQDPYLALLEHRNTPTEGSQTSQAQKLFGWRTKILQPTT